MFFLVLETCFVFVHIVFDCWPSLLKPDLATPITGSLFVMLLCFSDLVVHGSIKLEKLVSTCRQQIQLKNFKLGSPIVVLDMVCCRTIKAAKDHTILGGFFFRRRNSPTARLLNGLDCATQTFGGANVANPVMGSAYFKVLT